MSSKKRKHGKVFEEAMEAIVVDEPDDPEQTFMLRLEVDVQGYGRRSHQEKLRASVERSLRATLHDGTLAVRIAVRATPRSES